MFMNNDVSEGGCVVQQQDSQALPPLSPADLAALVGWEAGMHMPKPNEDTCRLLVRLSEDFQLRRPSWRVMDGCAVVDGLAVGLLQGLPLDGLERGVQALAERAAVITPESVMAFLSTACRGPHGRPRRPR